MSVIHRMEGCGWKVIEHKAPGLAGVAESEVMQRDLVIVHQEMPVLSNSMFSSD